MSTGRIYLGVSNLATNDRESLHEVSLDKQLDQTYFTQSEFTVQHTTTNEADSLDISENGGG